MVMNVVPVTPNYICSNETKSKSSNYLRFELSLKPCGDSDCPEFSYAKLVKEKLKLKKRLFKNTKAFENDNDGKNKSHAESMALYFEKKYGGKKLKHDRMQDIADVGYGYDDTDPFVDNSECYDELIPSTMTTQFGGFYINSGRLEFKQVSDDSNIDDDDDDAIPLSAHLKKSKKFYSSDEDSDSIPTKMIKKHKPTIEKRRKLSFQGKDKISKLTKTTKKKQTKVQLLVAKAKKAQQHIITSEKLHAKKQQSCHQHKAINGTSQLVAAADDSDKLSKNFQDGYQSSSSDDVSLARLSSSQDKLPQSLPHNIKEKISSLTKIAKSNENEGKVKFFSPDVNHLLLGIEVGSQSLSNRERSGIYQHLTPHMPCSKDTLIRRMKKLRASKEDETLRSPLNELKKAVAEVMVEQTRKYDEECTAQQLAKLDDRNPLAVSTDEDDDASVLPASGEEKVKRTYAPRRKFQWNNRLRSLLCNVVSVKVGQYETSRSKSSISAEDYIKNFLECEVKPLWPKGWMQSRVLYKESRDAHYSLTGAMNKLKKGQSLGNRKLGSQKSEKKMSLGVHPPQPHEASLTINIQVDPDNLIQPTRTSVSNVHKEALLLKQQSHSSVTDTKSHVNLSNSSLDSVPTSLRHVEGATNRNDAFLKNAELKGEPRTFLFANSQETKRTDLTKISFSSQATSYKQASQPNSTSIQPTSSTSISPQIDNPLHVVSNCSQLVSKQSFQKQSQNLTHKQSFSKIVNPSSRQLPSKPRNSISKQTFQNSHPKQHSTKASNAQSHKQPSYSSTSKIVSPKPVSTNVSKGQVTDPGHQRMSSSSTQAAHNVPLDPFSAELLKIALMSPTGSTFIPPSMGFSGEQALDDFTKFMKLSQGANYFCPPPAERPMHSSKAKKPHLTRPHHKKNQQNFSESKFSSSHHTKPDIFHPISSSKRYTPPASSNLTNLPQPSLSPATSRTYDYLSSQKNFFSPLLMTSPTIENIPFSHPKYSQSYVSASSSLSSGIESSQKVSDSKPPLKNVVDDSIIEALISGKRP